MHFDWTINPTNLLIMVSAVIAMGRWVVRTVVGQIHRIDVIERAVINSGWLRRTRGGKLEAVERQAGQ